VFVARKVRMMNGDEKFVKERMNGLPAVAFVMKENEINAFSD
jgi:hypothetical protein